MLIRDDTFGHVFRGSMEDVKAAVNEINKYGDCMGQERDLPISMKSWTSPTAASPSL